MNESFPRSFIGGWFRNAWEQYRERRLHESLLHQSVEEVVDVADPVIREAGKYRKLLQSPVEGAMQYCGTMIDAIPGPFELSRKSYNDDPFIKALFATPDDLEEVLRISPETKALHDQGHEGETIALLTMTRQEKTIFYHKQEGEISRRDVAQQAVNFIDHRLVAPTADLDRTKNKLVHRGLEFLSTMAMEKITTLRARKAELQEQKQYFSAMLKILGGKAHAFEMFAAPDPKKREDIRKVEQKLAEIENELSDVREQIATPEHSLDFVKNIMNSPDDSLAMESQSYRLNWMNVRVDDMPDAEGNEIALAEFSSGEELKRSAVLVSFSLGTTATN